MVASQGCLMIFILSDFRYALMALKEMACKAVALMEKPAFYEVSEIWNASAFE